MWPFSKKRETIVPDDVVFEGNRARYSSTLDCWELTLDDVDFTCSGISFDTRVFGWADAALSVIRRLEEEIDKRVIKELEGWPCDVSKRELLCVALDAYTESRTLDLSYVGDDSWADFGVNVIIRDGVIEDSYGGD
jgi:hypothetical protein